MPDSIALPALALLAAGLVALALVWPQGQGARSPAPFGHPLAAVQSPIAKAVAPLALRGREVVAAELAASKAKGERSRHAHKPSKP